MPCIILCFGGVSFTAKWNALVGVMLYGSIYPLRQSPMISEIVETLGNLHPQANIPASE